MSKSSPKPIIYHIPVCPFSQRIELYHDYALGKGSGALPEDRSRSSFVFDPHWRARPWPPRETWAAPVSDGELGLV